MVKSRSERDLSGHAPIDQTRRSAVSLYAAFAGIKARPARADARTEAQPHIDLEKQMRDAFPGAKKTEVGEVVVCATSLAVICRQSRTARRELVSMGASSLRLGKAYTRTTERQ